jgi:hypothetical protein
MHVLFVLVVPQDVLADELHLLMRHRPGRHLLRCGAALPLSAACHAASQGWPAGRACGCRGGPVSGRADLATAGGGFCGCLSPATAVSSRCALTAPAAVCLLAAQPCRAQPPILFRCCSVLLRRSDGRLALLFPSELSPARTPTGANMIINFGAWFSCHARERLRR